ncbi:hypothetical protein ACRW9N_02415 [Listeria aquatica]|uniref:hypothetical protein n=1 Tax=Listeria aquatica TaxID=1494960 RepID=UPI003EF18C4B
MRTETIRQFILKNPETVAETLNKATAEESEKFISVISLRLAYDRLVMLNSKVAESVNTICTLQKRLEEDE